VEAFALGLLTGEPVAHIDRAVGAVIVIVVCVAIISFVPKKTARTTRLQPDSTKRLLSAGGAEDSVQGARSSPDGGPGRGRKFKGLALAAAAGGLNGFAGYPIQRAKEECPHNPIFMFWFGLYALAIFGVVLSAHSVLRSCCLSPQRTSAATSEVAAPGRLQLPLAFDLHCLPHCLCAGVMWNVGMVTMYLSVQSELGMSVGYVICQLGLVVSGAWGMLLFREYRGWRNITAFWVLCLVLVGAMVVLSEARS
jgi:hypothetical protein